MLFFSTLKIPFFAATFPVPCRNFQIGYSALWGDAAAAFEPYERSKLICGFQSNMKSLQTLFYRAPEIVMSTAVYVCVGAIIGCTVEKKIMPNVKKLTRNIKCEKRRALVNLIAQCSLSATFAEYLKILMANKGSPGTISFAMAIFVMQPSIKEYISKIFC